MTYCSLGAKQSSIKGPVSLSRESLLSLIGRIRLSGAGTIVLSLQQSLIYPQQLAVAAASTQQFYWQHQQPNFYVVGKYKND